MKKAIYDSDVIKEKADFIKHNGAKLYFLRNHECNEDRSVEENLISILLSNKPLRNCRGYKDVVDTLNLFENDEFDINRKQNYPLLTMLSVTDYMNSIIRTESIRVELRNVMRMYMKHMDDYVVSDDSFGYEVNRDHEKITLKLR